MGFALPLTSADAAYVATWQSTEQRVKTVCSALGRPIETLCDHDHYKTALARLESDGVVVTVTGEVSFTAAAANFYTTGRWSEDAAVGNLTQGVIRATNHNMGQGSKVHSRIMRCLSALSATALFNALPTSFEKEVMLSSGGHMVGKFWSEVPRFVSNFMDNDHFRMAAQLRLALVVIPQGSLCQIAKKSDADDKCLAEMSDPCIHPHLCKRGPARQRPHRALMVSLKRVLERAGAEVDLERSIPALYRIDTEGKVTEAILDAVIITPGCFGTVPVDVTIRCPHAQRTTTRASETPSVAAGEGDKDKHTRYGSSVLPLALETYGRMGRKSMQSVNQLANQTVAASIGSKFHRGSDFIAMLRCDLEQRLLWTMADITLLSLGHTCQVWRSRGRQGRQ